ncbi:unnamed protein product [Rotaria magnacalcarata]|uniref:Cyclin-dependent kinase 2-associated protein n=1 Tax=Rotaria magnacalcarata TaxID=392030 RepID=A0A816EXE0_9BILA|nr:unnamed protein product [Rotaria magnacalcarata]CAF1655274.1 unnamed protein product [Rotaria magnacalcarata]CAF3897835.1 unnamed protein product [Rotaria magnacalcarata]CAF4842689.1 unnamed protein product [Rotaria magnacalcarata]
MDLSIRKQPQQPSPTPVSRPILNPAAPTTMLQVSAGRNSPLLPPPPPPPTTTATVPTHNSIHPQQIKQQPHSYVPVPSVIQQQQQQQQRGMHPSKYAQLLNVIEEMGKDIKPTYAGNKNSAERLRRAIASARVLVRECQLECDRNSRP